jgi:hypothetical protein
MGLDRCLRPGGGKLVLKNMRESVYRSTFGGPPAQSYPEHVAILSVSKWIESPGRPLRSQKPLVSKALIYCVLSPFFTAWTAAALILLRGSRTASFQEKNGWDRLRAFHADRDALLVGPHFIARKRRGILYRRTPVKNYAPYRSGDLLFRKGPI